MDSKRQSKRRLAAAGFTMIEMCVVVTITMVIIGFAVPTVQQTVFRYRLGAAVSSVTGAIRATRYQSLMKGYRYRLAISPDDRNYQLSSMIPPATSYSDVGTAVPMQTDHRSNRPVHRGAAHHWQRPKAPRSARRSTQQGSVPRPPS